MDMRPETSLDPELPLNKDAELTAVANRVLDVATIGTDFAAPGADGTSVQLIWADETGRLMVDPVDRETMFDPHAFLTCGNETSEERDARRADWERRQQIQPPKPRQLFVSKGHEVSKDGNIVKFTRSAKSTQPDMFDTKVCKLSKRQARKLRKETQRQMKNLRHEDLRFNA